MALINRSLTHFLLSILLSVSMPAGGQNPLIDAFADSYRLEADGHYSAAADRLLEVYSRDGYEINLRLGWLYYQGGSMDRSISYYQRAISLKPYGIEARFGLSYPLSAQGRWNEIMELYAQILQTDPQNSLAAYRLGLIHYNRQEYEKAEKLIEKVVNLYPFDYDALLLFAWTKFRLGKTREARILFEKTLMNRPGDASATEGLSLIR